MISSRLEAVDVPSAFTPSQPRLTLSEISGRLDLPKSTAHNLLATLLSRGFIEKVDGNHYALGRAVVALTQAVRVNVQLRDRAALLLRELADTCRESVYLIVLDQGYCLYTYAVESPRRLLARTAVGDRVRPHCTAVGKAMLAFLPPKEVDDIVARLGLPAFTEATITEVQALRAELEETFSRGYALDRQEHEQGTYCVGAPIFDERGQVIGACSVSGLDPDITQGRVGEIARQVRHVAQEISRRMGYVPPREGIVVTPFTTLDKRRRQP